MKNLLIIATFFAFGCASTSPVVAQNNEEEVDYILLNSNLGFEKGETAIIRDAKEIKTRLKKAKMNDYGPTDQFILIKLYAQAKGCTQPYNELSLIKGDKKLTVEYKLIQRGFCDKSQSLSNTILISKAAFGNHKINLTAPIQLQTTTY